MRTAFASICALAAIACVALNEAASQPDKKPEVKLAVRALKFEPKDPTISFGIGGKNKATTFADAAAVEKVVGKDAAKKLLEGVDFTKDQVVLVSWSTGGPPDGTLMYEGKDTKVTFYVQGPIGAQRRGERLRIGADFFAVPKNFSVNFDPKER
jgi:hypothetical protein